MSDRKHPCFICEAVQSSMAYAADPWCGDRCHKKVSELTKVPQKVLTPSFFDLVLDRIQTGTTELADFIREFSFVKNADHLSGVFKGVFSAEDLLREGTQPGNWRARGLPEVVKEWQLSREDDAYSSLPDWILYSRPVRRDKAKVSKR